MIKKHKDLNDYKWRENREVSFTKGRKEGWKEVREKEGRKDEEKKEGEGENFDRIYILGPHPKIK